MIVNGWLRPLKRQCWSLAPDWRAWHRFMSTQALGLGTIALTVAIYLEASRTVLIVGLVLTFALTAIGTLIEQPEVEPNEHDNTAA